MAGCDFLMVQAYDNIVVARVMKERLLDAAVISSLGDGLGQIIDRYPRISLIIDLSEVGYLSSAVLGKLVATHKKVKECKGRTAVAGLKPAIVPMFKVTGLDKIFEIFPDPGAGVTVWKRKPL
jgi:anti-sigma B factor antagonist